MHALPDAVPGWQRPGGRSNGGLKRTQVCTRLAWLTCGTGTVAHSRGGPIDLSHDLYPGMYAHYG